MDSESKLRIAMVSSVSVTGDIEGNLGETLRWAQNARNNGARIVCFPELNLTGYCLNKEVGSLAEEVPGQLTGKVVDISASTGMVVLAGLIEKEKKENFISHIVTGPEGFIGRYRKIHLSPGEKKYFSLGNEIPVFNWGKLRFGIGLCYDAHFPELSTVCALKHAHAVFFPHASPPPETAKEKRNRWLRYLPARAYDNSVYVAACNQAGSTGNRMKFMGAILCCDPRGEILAEHFGDEEKMKMFDIDFNVLKKIRSTRMGYFLKERCPRAYVDIVKNPLPRM